MKKITVRTQQRNQVIDITPQTEDYLRELNADAGILLVFSPHTTAGISINENADPSVKQDLISYLNKSVPQNFGFSHMEGNSDAHIKGSLVNFSQTFIVHNKRLQLGRWQGIFLMEFDGPRAREVWLQFSEADKN